MENRDAFAEEERDILGHLLAVEKEALSLAIEASEEADKRRAAARQRAELDYRAKYDELISSLETWLSAEKEKSDAAQRAAFSEYDGRLKTLPKDIEAFYSLVDSLLVGS